METEPKISTLNSVHFLHVLLNDTEDANPHLMMIFYQIWLKSSMEMFPKYQMKGIH